MQDKGALHRQNKRTLTEIMGAKDEIAFYVTHVGYHLEFEDEPKRFTIEGLLISNGDIDDMYTWSTVLYENGSRWDGNNAHGDEYKAFIREFVEENEFINEYFKIRYNER